MTGDTMILRRDKWHLKYNLKIVIIQKIKSLCYLDDLKKYKVSARGSGHQATFLLLEALV